MNKTLFCLSAGLIFFFTGCAAPLQSADSIDAATSAAKTEITRDNFKKITTADSMSIRYFNSTTSVDFSNYWLEARLHDGAIEPVYVVVIETVRSSSRSWAHWREAFDANGNKFPLNNESIDVKDTAPLIDKHALKEIYSAEVTRDYLDQFIAKPVAWRIYGQKGEETFTMRTKLIEGFLMKCDEALISKVKAKSNAGL